MGHSIPSHFFHPHSPPWSQIYGPIPQKKPWLTPQPEQQLQPSQWHPKSWPPSRARSAAQRCCGCPDRCALIWESSQENHWAEVLHGVSSKLQNCDVFKLMLESPTNVFHGHNGKRSSHLRGESLLQECGHNQLSKPGFFTQL